MDKKQHEETVHNLLRLMLEKRASDLFITVGKPPCAKIDGKMTSLLEGNLTADDTAAYARAIMTDKQAAEFQATKESNFAIDPEGIGRFRVNAFVQQHRVGLVIRVITTEVPTCEKLNLPEVLKELVCSKRGLVIFVGGTGTGKTTTLAALVNHRNENTHGHILTIEDPIEYVHPHKNCIVNQREVGVDTESWNAAIKNALRQAPDVILVGEIRDRESMEYALAISESGHLCLATLHANTANQAIERVINFFPEERHPQLLMDLSMNLKAMVSQRLVPLQSSPGRVAAIEILINSPLVSDLISKGKIGDIREVMMKSREAYGMQTFEQHLFDLYESGVISQEDALRNADQINDLRLNIKLNSKKTNPLDVPGTDAPPPKGSTPPGGLSIL